jgi:NDP-sugar pyrophosphorylase family protein
MQPTLVILAAGMASRYGSMKQVEGFGPAGETIMDYSVYDAIRSGFKKVIFIIRKDFATQFRDAVDEKLKGRIEVEYVYQEMSSFLEGYMVPEGRTKPWGTAHAVLCTRDKVKDPFIVINADDFYGRDAFGKACTFLLNECSPDLYAILGYELVKTLSEHGSVSRGVCEVNEEGYLLSIKERTNIYRDGKSIVFEENGVKHQLAPGTTVSMNFFGFHPSIFELTERLFREFLKANISNPKAEFFIPIVADAFINQGLGKIKVIPTPSKWFGVTYKEDAPEVKESIRELIAKGEYPEKLWS